MIKMTIVRQDNLIGVDGVFRKVDCSSLPEDFIALQWYEEEKRGEIEWEGNPKPKNTIIKKLDAYRSYFDLWDQENNKANGS